MDIDSLVQTVLSFFHAYWILFAALAVLLLFIGHKTLKTGVRFFLLLLVLTAFFVVLGVYGDVF